MNKDRILDKAAEVYAKNKVAIQAHRKARKLEKERLERERLERERLEQETNTN